MPKPAWTPWQQVVALRDDLRTGALALHEFAADLYDVALQRGTRPIYEDPAQFFALTYPTVPLRELARDVVHRLAAKNLKAVRQLELTYGGGKTHTLITLFHLAHAPETLPDLPSVRDFKAHFDVPAIPKARIAVLPFDKIDVEKGMVGRSPAGEERMLRKPWSLLAWQIAGAGGLRLLHPDDRDEERPSAPAENLLRDLLALPARDNLATLVLIDEVLMFARGAVDADPAWTERLKNFFQALTQAATKVDRCAIVASLLATNPQLSDAVGRQITADLYDIFRREREQGVEPVGKGDVAEVLRRRFFTPDSIQDQSRFRANAIEAVKNIATLDDDTKKGRAAAEERFVESYPFHPDLTEVLYAKWTGVQGFQRTRGVLRTFALALRDSEAWDTSPVVGPNVFLLPPKADGISEAARELTQIATFDDSDAPQDWTAILSGELTKARAVQQEYGSLQHRELEQAVVATFLHSQPAGRKAQLRELKVLVGGTRPDPIDLHKALREWFDRSWFLDESLDAPGNRTDPPPAWRLGSRPNLKQMHSDALTTIADLAVDGRLLEEIRKTKSLTAAARAAGAQVHVLPEKPAFVDDDGEFRYAVLGPAAASDSGKPSAFARRFLDETTTSDRPRTHRNAVVLAVPSRDGVDAARRAVHEYLGWQAVQDALTREGQKVDLVRQQNLDAYTAAARDRVADAIVQAYCIVVTVSAENQAQAFKIQVTDGPLFSAIKADSRARVQDSAISPDAMLPGGPYDLWRETEDARWVKDVVGAFAQNARLPKMLSRQAIVDTVVRGVEEGYFVARLRRPDGSFRTWWRQRPEPAAFEDPLLEVVLPGRAELSSVPPALLRPGVIDQLWMAPAVRVGALRGWFDGQHVMTVSRGGFDEPIPIPRAAPDAVDEAVREAIRAGHLWLTSGPASILGEDVPPGLLTEAAELQAPPAPVSTIGLLPDALPGAWQDGRTTVLSLAAGLSQAAGRTLPWTVVRSALDEAFRMRLLERAADSGPWPCDYAGAAAVAIQLPAAETKSTGQRHESSGPPAPPDTRMTPEVSLTGAELQDLVDLLPELLRISAGHQVTFNLRVALKGADRPPDEVARAVSSLLAKVKDGIEVQ